MNLIREIDRGTPASPAPESVTLTIDGAAVTVAAGTSIMRAASLAGTDIPKLCATDSMQAFGSCRIGSVRGMEVLDRIIAGEDVEANIALVEALCETMKFGSLCALGGFTPYPVMSALRHFPEDFARAREVESMT